LREKSSIVLALGLLSVLAGCHFDANRGTGDMASANAQAGGSASATLHWEMPTENTNGTPLTDLQGYTIVYGPNPETMNRWVQVTDIGTTSYEVAGLGRGTWYFAVLSFTSSGANSALSNLVSKTIN
jgi:hypothetical protein